MRSGRGWLAIVNALTEEVADSDNEDEPFEVGREGSARSGLPALGMPLSSLNSGVQAIGSDSATDPTCGGYATAKYHETRAHRGIR